jgi:solute carrier family 25 (mitochondrial iron transporter), member 28/37
MEVHVEEEVDGNTWEQWDSKSPFWIHCMAGSFAGVMEHTTVYPLDTVRTHIQVCASCLHRNPASLTNRSAALHSNSVLTKQVIHPGHLPTGVWQTMRFLVNEHTKTRASTAVTTTLPRCGANYPLHATLATLRNFFQGQGRLWRGVQMSLIGSIPADGLYFCSYEAVKAATVDPRMDHVTAWSSLAAGAAAALMHDVVMTPLDTMKQRMQLGHYHNGVSAAFRSILQTEGWRALYVSLPITLVTNIPYGMVMVSTHEVCKRAWSKDSRPEWQTVLMASSLAGSMAAAITTPLDRIKTALQTQKLTPACLVGDTTSHLLRVPPSSVSVRHASWWDAAANIHRAEGMMGFARGLVPRILSHTPAVAISWTTYETVKHALLQHYHYCD